MSGASASEERTLLIHYGEIGLKGRNQADFRRRLRDNVRRRLRASGLDWAVRELPGFLTVSVPPDAPTQALDRAHAALATTFGVVWFALARRVEHARFVPETRQADWTRLTEALLALAGECRAAGQTFAVRVNRADKSLPFTSAELDRQLGALVLQRTSWTQVNLSRPDVTFHVDLRRECAYVFANKRRGPGGLPVGTSGRVLALLSGGIDSPVAAWLMAKRGCEVDFIHFTVAHQTPEQARHSKVFRLAQRLGEATLGGRLYVVPYTYFDLALLRGQADYDLVLFRRFMARVAERLARQLGAQALVSGDNLAQVASQTLPNLVATSRAAELPVLRPLLTYDKEEIVSLAKQIGTYDLSIAPYKDCCALISRHPRTRSQHERLAELEARLLPDYERLIEQTLNDAVWLDLGWGDSTSTDPHAQTVPPDDRARGCAGCEAAGQPG
jgi:thiamine biosynthesis protein ThiI